MNYKKTLYDLLEIPPSASDAEIDAAHLRLSRQFASGAHDLAPDEAERQHKLISQAYWTLSDKARRTFYDASLTAHGSPVQLAVEIREPRWTPQKILLMVIGSLIAVGMVIQIAFMLVAYRQSQKMVNGRSLAEERVMAEEYRQTTGGRSESEMAEERAAAEQRRLDYEKREQEQRQAREVEESRRYADRVSSELRHAEENARREAEYEKQRQVQEEQRKQQEEEARLQNLKSQWR